jgi:hypothetical protein
MEGIYWSADTIAFTNLNLTEEVLDKGKFQEINNFVEDNITNVSKQVKLTIRGDLGDENDAPAIFSASVNAEQPLLDQITGMIDKSEASKAIGTSQIYFNGKQISDSDTCESLKIEAGSVLFSVKV